MVTSLIEHERIKTTLGKAKALQPFANKVLKMAIKGNDNKKTMSKLCGIVKTPAAYKKLINDLAPRYE